MNPFGVILVAGLLMVAAVTRGSTNILRSRSSSEESTVPVQRNRSRDHRAIPESFDAREHWANCPSIGEIPNQGCCNTNYALVPTAVLTDRACIAYNSSELVFSATDPITCCQECASMRNDGCLGGDPIKVWDFATNTGIASSSCLEFPLSPVACVRPLACPLQCTSGETGRSVASTRRVSYPYFMFDSEVSSIQKEIMTYGPVEAEITLYRDFASYDGKSVYADSGADISNIFLGKHSVKIIGWGKVKDTEYWLVINTFGENWGADGTAKVLRGYNTAGIESFIRAAMLNIG